MGLVATPVQNPARVASVVTACIGEPLAALSAATKKLT